MFTFQPKRILVPMDASEPSFAAWDYAAGLARRFGSRAEAVFVQELATLLAPPMYVPPPADWNTEEFVRAIRPRIGKARLHVLKGDPAAEVVWLAEKWKADLVVMGSHGKKGLRRALLGSVAESVVHSSPAPVLTLRAAPPPIRSVLAPVKFTAYSDKGFQYAVAVAAALKARVTALHVGGGCEGVTESELQMEKMVRRLPDAARKACPVTFQVGWGGPVDVILSEAKEHQLVVVVAHRKSLLRDLVIGTTAERVLRHCPVPVLSLPSVSTGKSSPRKAATRFMEPIII